MHTQSRKKNQNKTETDSDTDNGCQMGGGLGDG